MEFQTGQSGNPVGRPKGSYGGRIMALASLDKLLAKKKNQKALMEALEKDLLKDPVYFFKTVVMPLLPREAKLSLDRDGVIQWKSLIGVSADPVCSPPFAPEATEGREQLGGGSNGNPHPSPSTDSTSSPQAVLRAGPLPSQGEGVAIDVESTKV